MTFSKFDNQIIALAGIVQSATMVDQVARHGKYNSEHYNPLLQSLFEFDAEKPVDVYNGLTNLKLGLEQLATFFNRQETEQLKLILHYVLSIIHLEKKLSKNKDVLNVIHNRLEHLQFRCEHFDDNIDSLNSGVADIYKDCISQLTYRIHVQGQPEHLKINRNAEQIRTMLLAGIRSAVLWRQLGGRRWHFIFYRGNMQKKTAELLKQLP